MEKERSTMMLMEEVSVVVESRTGMSSQQTVECLDSCSDRTRYHSGIAQKRSY